MMTVILKIIPTTLGIMAILRITPSVIMKTIPILGITILRITIIIEPRVMELETG